jgi:hypothetical protein
MGRVLKPQLLGGAGRLAVMRLLLILVFIAGIGPAVGQSWLPMTVPPPLPRERPEVVAAPDATPATATEDELAPVPEEKPETVPENEPADTPAFPLPRPRPEPKIAQEDEPAEEKQEPVEPKIYQTACPAVVQGEVQATQLPPISENQCVARSPLALTGVMVNGRMVEVIGGVVADCSVATVLPQWAAAIDGYLQSRSNTQLTAINVGTSYFCRRVNNAAHGNISEHGFGNALDITGFAFEDGRTVAVETGWSDALSEDGRLLRFACSLFTTTLGPEANALHHDHFHVDMGCHGGRCTARLCE